MAMVEITNRCNLSCPVCFSNADHSIFAVNLSSPLSAKSVDTCFIKANTRDVYVIVYDVDRSGNKGYELWKGWIRQGTEQAQMSTSKRANAPFLFLFFMHPPRSSRPQA
jgi:hypothetical protein